MASTPGTRERTVATRSKFRSHSSVSLRSRLTTKSCDGGVGLVSAVTVNQSTTSPSIAHRYLAGAGSTSDNVSSGVTLVLFFTGTQTAPKSLTVRVTSASDVTIISVDLGRRVRCVDSQDIARLDYVPRFAIWFVRGHSNDVCHNKLHANNRAVSQPVFCPRFINRSEVDSFAVDRLSINYDFHLNSTAPQQPRVRSQTAAQASVVALACDHQRDRRWHAPGRWSLSPL